MALFAAKKKAKAASDEVDTQPQKLEQLYLTYRKLMFYVAYSILHDIHLSEDAVQQAFLRVMNHLEKISEITCPQTKNFLVIIVKNISLNMYNARRDKAAVSYDEVEGWVCAGADVLEEQEQAIYLDEMMRLLPESYRDALMLRYDNGYTSSEIASILQISEENAKKRLQRARARLADLIAAEEGG